MPRSMTSHEMDLFYKKKVMPCGHGHQYWELARGGAMVNIECPVCQLKLNVLDPEMTMLPFGANLQSLRIGEVLYEPKGYVAMQPTTLWSVIRDAFRTFFCMKPKKSLN